MRGIVLAGGLGVRLRPLTLVTNKHLLPIYSSPMVFYPLQMLANVGITEVLIVVGAHSCGEFLRLLKDGKDFGLHLSYVYQDGEGGIAHALSLAEDFAHGEPICVVLGDNIIEYDIVDMLKDFHFHYFDSDLSARVLLSKVSNPQEFGCPVFDGNADIINIEEKPKKPKSEYAVTGIYMYDEHVFKKLKQLKPSQRGELEITDLNNIYASEGSLKYTILEGYWADCGYDMDGYYEVTELVKTKGANKLSRILNDELQTSAPKA